MMPKSLKREFENAMATINKDEITNAKERATLEI